MLLLEYAFFWLQEKVELSKFGQNSMDAFPVVDWVVIHGDQHVIHVDDEPSFMHFFLEDGVHHHLEGGWQIGQSEEHHSGFEQPFVSDEGRLPFVSSSYGESMGVDKCFGLSTGSIADSLVLV